MSSAVVIDWNGLPDGKSRTVCPKCGRGPKDQSMGVTVAPEKGIAHCFRCEYVEYRSGFSREGIRDFGRRVVEQETLSDFWLGVWNSCTPIHGDSREYLLARNCMIPPSDGDLRCHPRLKHPSGYIGHALVGLITDAVTGQPISLLRTWILPDGRKATDRPRMLAWNQRKQGGVIRLYPNDAVQGGLGVAEGIETALSLAHAITPVWALVDAGNMASFAPIPGIEALTIAVDNDAHGKGQRAAARCADLWKEAGKEVRLVLAPDPGSDLNDLRGGA